MSSRTPDKKPLQRDESTEQDMHVGSKTPGRLSHFLRLASVVAFVFLAALLCFSIIAKTIEINQLTKIKDRQKQKLQKQEAQVKTRERLIDEADNQWRNYDCFTGAKVGGMQTQMTDRLLALDNHDMSLVASFMPEDWKTEGVFDSNQMHFEYSIDQSFGGDQSVRFDVSVEGVFEDQFLNRYHFCFGRTSLYLPISLERQRGKIEIEWFNKDGKFVIECRNVSNSPFLSKGTTSQYIVLSQPRTVFGNVSSNAPRCVMILTPSEVQKPWGMEQEIFYRTDGANEERLKISFRVRTRANRELLHSPYLRDDLDELDLEERYDFDDINDGIIRVMANERSQRNLLTGKSF